MSEEMQIRIFLYSMCQIGQHVCKSNFTVHNFSYLFAYLFTTGKYIDILKHKIERILPKHRFISIVYSKFCIIITFRISVVNVHKYTITNSYVSVQL